MSLDVHLIDEEGNELYWANITHNLNEMASEAGIYQALWRPEEIGAVYAKDIKDIVMKGLTELILNPNYYKQFNASNGWGLYKDFVPFVAKYLKVIIEYPDAKIVVSR